MIEDLRKIVGEDHATDDEVELYVYGGDASIYQSMPAAVVRPGRVEEVQELLRYANENKIPIVPRGAGSGTSGSSIPVKGGIVVDMKRMNRILDVRVGDLLCKVEPGVINDELNRQMKETGFFFAPNPASGRVATIGGMVATNASGMRALKYGATRDAVLGMKVVMADGSLIDMGVDTLIDACGYQLTKLMVGSEGTLGVIVECTLKLTPLPEGRKMGVVAFKAFGDAGSAISQVIREGIVPSMMEIMNRVSIDVVNQTSDLDLPEAEGLIIFECDGFKDQYEHEIERMKGIFEENGGFGIHVSDDPDEMARIYDARSKLLPSIGQYKQGYVVPSVGEDLAVPISKLPETVREIQRVSGKYDILISTYGHAGEGVLHNRLLIDPTVKEEWEKLEKAVDEIYAFVAKVGGTCTGEHGVALVRAPYFLKERKTAVDLMKRIKKVFDPNDILNPGKLMDAPEDYLRSHHLRYPVEV
jgi:glycolate oxidase